MVTMFGTLDRFLIKTRGEKMPKAEMELHVSNIETDAGEHIKAGDEVVLLNQEAYQHLKKGAESAGEADKKIAYLKDQLKAAKKELADQCLENAGLKAQVNILETELEGREMDTPEAAAPEVAGTW